MDSPTKERLPFVPRELLQWLEENIPPLNPRPGLAMDKLWFYAGQRHVVEVLAQALEDQEKQELE